jgi:hypothetical protein
MCKQEDVTEAEAAALVDKYQKLGNQATLSLATSESVAEDMTAQMATSLNVCAIPHPAAMPCPLCREYFSVVVAVQRATPAHQ